MFKKFTLAFTIGLTLSSFAQVKKTEDFNIVKPVYKTQSYYSYLEVVDTRKDTSSYGIVQKGAFNKKALVQPVIPIAVQLNEVFQLLKSNPDNAPKDTLVILLRDLKFAERTEALKETGFFFLRANTYSKKNGVYGLISNTDMAETVNAMDVTQKNYRHASETINDFIAKAMSTPPVTENAITFEQLKDIDAIEKKTLALYNAEKLTDGVYASYFSFRDQKPNYKDFKVTYNKKNKVTGLEVLSHKGEYIAATTKQVYAFVEKGTAYIATEYGYYPLTKKDDDYFYTGRVRVSADSGSVVAASIMFGIIGGLIASSSNSDTYNIMIDHLNGTTILQDKVSN